MVEGLFHNGGLGGGSCRSGCRCLESLACTGEDFFYAVHGLAAELAAAGVELGAGLVDGGRVAARHLMDLCLTDYRAQK